MNASLLGLGRDTEMRAENVAAGLKLAGAGKIVLLLGLSPGPAKKAEPRDANKWRDIPAPMRWGLNE